MIDRIKKVLAETFVLNTSEIPNNVAFGELEEWDSLGHVHLMNALQEEFGVSFTMAEIEQLGTLAGIAEILQQKGQG